MHFQAKNHEKLPLKELHANANVFHQRIENSGRTSQTREFQKNTAEFLLNSVTGRFLLLCY